MVPLCHNHTGFCIELARHPDNDLRDYEKIGLKREEVMIRAGLGEDFEASECIDASGIVMRPPPKSGKGITMNSPRVSQHESSNKRS